MVRNIIAALALGLSGLTAQNASPDIGIDSSARVGKYLTFGWTNTPANEYEFFVVLAAINVRIQDPFILTPRFIWFMPGDSIIADSYIQGPIEAPAAGGGSGSGRPIWQVPNNPALVGLGFFTQVALMDPDGFLYSNRVTNLVVNP